MVIGEHSGGDGDCLPACKNGVQADYYCEVMVDYYQADNRVKCPRYQVDSEAK